MNKKLFLVLFFSLANSIHSFAMHHPDQVPLEVENRSNFVVTIIYARPGDVSERHFNMLWPSQKFPNQDWQKLAFTTTYTVRIITAQGHYEIGMETKENMPIINCLLATTERIGSWKAFPVLSAVGLTKLTARVREDGFIKFIQHKPSPQDGRPDVSLLAYEELLGMQEFATTEQILGITSEIKPKEAYQKRIEQFCAIYVHYSEAEGIKQLIKWAAEKLSLE